jgi:hypothetical protein
VNRTAYLYSDRGATAALHLLETTALSYCTTQTPTYWAGADCIRVELTTPMPSTGERLLWDLVKALSTPGETRVDLWGMSDLLDADTLATVHTALGMAWAIESEVGA